MNWSTFSCYRCPRRFYCWPIETRGPSQLLAPSMHVLNIRRKIPDSGTSVWGNTRNEENLSSIRSRVLEAFFLTLQPSQAKGAKSRMQLLFHPSAVLPQNSPYRRLKICKEREGEGGFFFLSACMPCMHLSNYEGFVLLFICIIYHYKRTSNTMAFTRT